ncbi:hypothetical protein LQR31_05665 [Chromobacterium vaccinii]|uniref:hypothetical protein n=1 Tax=Chromobacterium vaccinii TaxID=1108595 RepID=UPI001E55BF2B|nr:hypothetical protein [Chromobacterium vaccinii]MCD4483961.1 hypothetical protein [Chromobacterium vaccinii]
MSHQQSHEKELLSAIRQIPKTIPQTGTSSINISILLTVTSNLPLTNLESIERTIRRGYYQILKTSTAFHPSTSKIAYHPLTWLDLCHENGFQREKALRAPLGPAPNAIFFAIAMRRLNDWAPKVREAARERLPTISENTNPEFVADVLCATLPHWVSWGRIEEDDRQVLLSIVSIKKVAESLKTRILSTTSGPTASVLTQLGRRDVFDCHLEEIAKKALQPSVRAKAYRCLLEGKVTWCSGREWQWIDQRYRKGRFNPILCNRALTIEAPFLETLQSASIDRSPIVRRVAGEILIRNLGRLGDAALILAEQLASDSSPSLAERGRFILCEMIKPA